MRADAVLLLAFGGPTRPEEIRPFLANVTRGRRIPPERLEASSRIIRGDRRAARR
jgi:ferrochelatase